MIYVVLKSADDEPAFTKLLDDEGYTYTDFKNLPTMFSVNTPLNTFKFKESPLIESIDDGDEGESQPTSFDYTDTPLPDCRSRRRDYTDVGSAERGDSWALARMCRRKNPFSRTRAPYNSQPSFKRATRTGVGVNIYIVDLGMDTSHPDFEGRAFGLDGNPFIWDFPDSGNHGLLTSSNTIGKRCGMATGATLYFEDAPLIDSHKGQMIPKIDAIIAHYIAQGKPAVVSFSIGVKAATQASSMAAFRLLADAGLISCHSGGNNFEDFVTLPRAFTDSDDDMIVVGGSSIDDNLMRFNIGGTGSSERVDIYAPGQALLTAWPNSNYRGASGTSMATPLVAGVLACMLEGYQRMTTRAEVQALRKKLIENSTKGVLRVSEVDRQKFHFFDNKNRLVYLDPELAIEDIEGLTKA